MGKVYKSLVGKPKSEEATLEIPGTDGSVLFKFMYKIVW
jgi:hypothetical protein